MVSFEAIILGVISVVVYVALRKDIQAGPLKKKSSSVKKKPAEYGKELVYILANPSYRPGLFKIGLTKRTMLVRMRELFTTGVPTPFIKCLVLETEDCGHLEGFLHRHFEDKRVNPRREWFELNEDDISFIADSKDPRYKVSERYDNSIRKALGVSEDSVQ